jgi:hypothetical protein
MLKYNALYQSLKKVSAEWHAGHVEWSYIWNYLKFYRDGTVIYCSSSDHNFININSWFDKDKKDVFLYTGEFRLANDFRVSINIPVSVGQLEMDGGIQSNSIVIKITNKELSQIDYWDEYSCVD